MKMSQSICFSRGFKKKNTKPQLCRPQRLGSIVVRPQRFFYFGNTSSVHLGKERNWKGIGKEKKDSLVWQMPVLPGNSGWITPCHWQSWTYRSIPFPF